jgi:integrase
LQYPKSTRFIIKKFLPVLATFKYVFNRKNVRLKKGDLALVQLRVTINRQQKYFTTGIYVEKHQWSGVENAWITNLPVAADYNALLFDIITKIRKAEVQALQAGHPLSHDVVQKIIKGDDSGSFFDFMMEEIGKRSDIANGTKAIAKNAARKLKRLGIVKFSDLTFEKIQKANDELMKTEKLSSVDTFHTAIACYINRAINLNLFPMSQNPYIKFKRQRPKFLDRKYLTAEELLTIDGAKLANQAQRVVRDMFLFCCYTGLAYSDFQQLRPSDIVLEKGRLFIKTFREKTEEKSVIFLFEKSKELLQKYSGRREGYCFPKIRNDNFNRILKRIARQCGFEKNLTVHMARHTFATTVMLSNGVSLEVTQKALGHAKISTTQLYAKMVDGRVAAEMAGAEKFFSPPQPAGAQDLRSGEATNAG